MEEQEKRKFESQDHPCEEQTHSLSVVLSVEEEAAEMPSDWGLNSAEDSVTNGFGAEEGDEGVAAAPGLFPGTTYWSVSEGPGSPLLLCPVAGPSRSKPVKRRVERASRAGSSRIPGRDHRRYYHEYWRGEFLMDFDAQGHRMLCMVCGSSLATLKLSTIKRHIQQKHPESLLWTAADKEAIRVGWDSHLGLQGAPSPALSSTQSQEGALKTLHLSSGEADPGTSETPCGNGSPAPGPSPAPPPQTREPSPDPPAHVLERYLNDSLHAWFRQEFLMEYRAEEGRLVCMVCAAQVPSLHLDHIKRHVLDGHPVSLLYSAEERHSILHTWAQKQEIIPLRDLMSVKSDSEPGGGGSSVGTRTHVERGGGGVQGPPPSPPSQRSPCGRLPKRWRLGYLVARCPKQRAVVCMVCSQALPMANAGTFRQHIREHHPETATLSRPERRALADGWTKRAGVAETTGTLCQSQEGAQEEEEDKEIQKQEGSASDRTAPGTPRHGQHAGKDQHCKDQQSKDQQRKDQQRKYQERWRMEYLMEYDIQRRGLVCVVCGATLATLKVSTIKRHIQQVHPQTLGFSPAQREEALRNFSHPAVAVVALPASPLRTPGSPPGSGQDRD